MPEPDFALPRKQANWVLRYANMPAIMPPDKAKPGNTGISSKGDISFTAVYHPVKSPDNVGTC